MMILMMMILMMMILMMCFDLFTTEERTQEAVSDRSNPCSDPRARQPDPRRSSQGSIYFMNYFNFLALFSSEKKTLMYSPCPSVCELIFSRTMRRTEPKFSALLHLYIRWNRSKFGSFPTNRSGKIEKKPLKTEPLKAG